MPRSHDGVGKSSQAITSFVYLMATCLYVTALVNVLARRLGSGKFGSCLVGAISRYRVHFNSMAIQGLEICWLSARYLSRSSTLTSHRARTMVLWQETRLFPSRSIFEVASIVNLMRIPITSITASVQPPSLSPENYTCIRCPPSSLSASSYFWQAKRIPTVQTLLPHQCNQNSPLPESWQGTALARQTRYAGVFILSCPGCLERRYSLYNVAAYQGSGGVGAISPRYYGLSLSALYQALGTGLVRAERDIAALNISGYMCVSKLLRA